MRRSIPAVPALLIALLLPDAAAAQQTPDTRSGIAVLPFASGIAIGRDREMMESLSVGVQQIMITELAQNTQLRLVDRSVIRELMAEQDLGATGRIDPETAAHIGRLVGARYVVTGSFHDMDDQFRLDGRIVNVETSEILMAEQVVDRPANLYSAVLAMGGLLSRGARLPPLPREIRDAREARATTIPREAAVLYSQAQFFQDRGQTERARELYRRLTAEFPQLTEAREALRQISDSGS